MWWGTSTDFESPNGKSPAHTPQATLQLYVIIFDSPPRPGGEIGRRRGLKIPRRKACRFDSGPGHQQFKTVVKNFVLIDLLFKDLWLSYE